MSIQHTEPKSPRLYQPMKSSQMIYEQALSDFPYPNLAATGGYMPVDKEDKPLSSSLEYVFSGEKLARKLLGAHKIASTGSLEGWLVLDLLIDDGEIRIEGIGNIVRNGDWKRGFLFPDYKPIHCDYCLETRKWAFWISR